MYLKKLELLGFKVMVNDPPLALHDPYGPEEQTALNVAAPGVLGNDSDAEGDPLTTDMNSDVSSSELEASRSCTARKRF